MIRRAQHVLLVLCGACGGAQVAGLGAALERGDVPAALRAYEARGRPDAEALAAVAERVLEGAVLDRDDAVRDAGLSQLKMAGTAAVEVLGRLAAEASDPIARARVWQMQAQLGNTEAAEALGGLADSPVGSLRALAVAQLDAERDRPRVLVELDSPHLEVRLAAVGVLRGAEPDAAVRRALQHTARRDPDVAVRSAALVALGGQGSPAVEAVANAMREDPSGSVRAAALRAWLQLDAEGAMRAAQAPLEGTPTADSVELARTLMLVHPHHEPARGHLVRALAVARGEVALAAAVAIQSLPRGTLTDEVIRQALSRAALPAVKLSLSLSARGSASDRGLKELAALKGPVGTEASAELARRGDAAAVGSLVTRLADASPRVRSIAARALARDLGRPHRVRRLLLDRDVAVRLAAAGAVLASRNWAVRA